MRKPRIKWDTLFFDNNHKKISVRESHKRKHKESEKRKKARILCGKGEERQDATKKVDIEMF